MRVPRNAEGRDFVVGDIHGAFDLVLEGMRRVQFDRQRDRLFCVGDLVDRGPQSARAARFLKQPYVHAVSGNHEFKLLDLYAGGHPDWHELRWFAESRTVALSSAAIQALASLPRRIDGKVFPWATVSGFKSIWKRCVARARRDHLHAALRARLVAEGADADVEIRALIYKKRAPQPRTLAHLIEVERSDFLANLRFHDLRHEATSRLFEKELGIMEVASMTGHKSLAMLKRYTHVEAEKLASKLG